MANSGFIILPRDEFDDPFFDDPWKMGAWVELLRRARGVADNLLARGQLSASNEEIAKWLRATKSKVQRFIAGLVRIGRLTIIRIASHRKNQTLYSVCNFDRYNGKSAKTPTKSRVEPVRESACAPVIESVPESKSLFESEPNGQPSSPCAPVIESVPESVSEPVPVAYKEEIKKDNVRQREKEESSAACDSAKPDTLATQNPAALKDARRSVLEFIFTTYREKFGLKLHPTQGGWKQFHDMLKRTGDDPAFSETRLMEYWQIFLLSDERIQADPLMFFSTKVNIYAQRAQERKQGNGTSTVSSTGGRGQVPAGSSGQTESQRYRNDASRWRPQRESVSDV